MIEDTYIPIGDISLQAEKESAKKLILKKDKDAKLSLTMVVGELEFLAIAKEKKLIQTPRPLTHEMYLRILSETDIRFLRVEIYDQKEQVYFARVIYLQGSMENAADARPSDALALAIHHNLPVIVHSKLFRKEPTPIDIERYQDLIKTVKF